MNDDKAAAAYHPSPAPESGHDGECSSLYGRALGRNAACDCAPEATASEKLQHWLDHAQKARPDLDNLLWGPGYEKAPLHSDWVREVMAELAALKAQRERVLEAAYEWDSAFNDPYTIGTHPYTRQVQHIYGVSEEKS